MIVNFSKNPILQVFGIIYWNIGTILFFTLASTLAYVLCCIYHINFFILPAIPISVLGGALAIFLAFKKTNV